MVLLTFVNQRLNQFGIECLIGPTNHIIASRQILLVCDVARTHQGFTAALTIRTKKISIDDIFNILDRCVVISRSSNLSPVAG